MKHKAFTLIELIVVVALIGTLAAVGVVVYNGYIGAAKASTAKLNHKFVANQVSLIITNCELEVIYSNRSRAVKKTPIHS